MLQAVKPIFIPELSTEESRTHWTEEKRENLFLKKYETGISSLVSVFLNRGPVQYILSSPQPQKNRHEQREKLKKIFRKFRELAYHMWCQPSDVSCQYTPTSARFKPETMELDNWAVFGRTETEAERLRGDRIMINMVPAIVGVTIDPDGKRMETTYLKHKVWTVDCQMFTQWQKALKDASAPAEEKSNVDVPVLEHPEQGAQKSDCSNDGQNGSATLEDKDAFANQLFAMSQDVMQDNDTPENDNSIGGASPRTI
jgi:hypothetical protein